MGQAFSVAMDTTIVATLVYTQSLIPQCQVKIMHSAAIILMASYVVEENDGEGR